MKSENLSAAAGATAWEHRALDRVLGGERERLLARSKLLVDAARQLVEEEGLEGLTLRAVLDRTGLSRRAFYDRFESKDELLLAVFEDTLARAAEHYGSLAAGIESPLERLRLIVKSIVAESQARAVTHHSVAMSREHLRLAEQRPADLARALEPITALLARQIEAGVESGSMRSETPHLTATLIHNLIASTLHNALLGSAGDGEGNGAAQGEALADAVWLFCERALRV